MMQQMDLAEVREDILKIDASNFDNGLYYLNVQVNQEKAFTKKVLVHRLY